MTDRQKKHEARDERKVLLLPNSFPLPFCSVGARGGGGRCIYLSIPITPEAFNPYPDYKSDAYTNQYGVKVDCYLDKESKIRIPPVRIYKGIPNGFPDPIMGTNSLLGMRDDICYDRYGRLGPYGLGYSLNRGGTGAALEGDRDGADEMWREVPEVDFRTVRWVEAQQTCTLANKDRFAEVKPTGSERFRSMYVGHLDARDEGMEESRTQAPDEVRPSNGSSSQPDKITKLPRTAVVIRTWSDYPFTTEDILYLRSMIAELSLNSGGEYTVHFLIQVKDDNAPIWSDDESYQRVLHDALPEEFRGMGTLWSERQMGLLYGGLAESFARGLPVHGVYRSAHMPLQYFAYTHPEYDFIWNWEMDVRYTGHWYHLFDSVSKWAKAQPRKGLWERNSRFYVPSEHGSWEDFRQMVRVQTQLGTNSPNNIWSGLHTGTGTGTGTGTDKREGDIPIWGPEPPPDDDKTSFPNDPTPPTTYDADKYTWGVGEDADLITFNTHRRHVSKCHRHASSKAAPAQNQGHDWKLGEKFLWPTTRIFFSDIFPGTNKCYLSYQHGYWNRVGTRVSGTRCLHPLRRSITMC